MPSTPDLRMGHDDETSPLTLGVEGLQALIDRLWADDYEVFGPSVRDGVIRPGLLRSVADLPCGWRDEQEGGSYRLVRRADEARFGHAVGPESWKRILHPPRTPVWTMTRTSQGELEVSMHEAPPRRLALFGVRPCELAAIHKQDRVLREGPHADPHYRSQRSDNVIIVVNCAAPAATCFCASTSTGPAATAGFDLAITELVIDEQEVAYVVEVGSTIGADLLASIEAEPATTRHLELARSVLEEAARSMTRRLDSDGAHDVLFAQLESSYWAEIAERCLMCGNCTSVCPTCFCTDLVDVTDLSGEVADRWQVWDSCFSLTFSQLGSEPHRLSGGSRYRQWLVHKLASWIDQYGESGCVGCGRCITWCPVGIDLTAEIEQLSIERSEV